MFKPIRSYSGFSIDNLKVAKQFYSEVLEMKVTEEGPGIRIEQGGGGSVLAYVKDDHQPASYTTLNFEVENINEAVEALAKKGVNFERYNDFPHEETGILRGISAGLGPDIAWFKDPAGNVLAVLQEG